MADQRSTISRVVEEIGVAFLPLEDLLSPTNASVLFAELGLDTAPDLHANTNFSEKLQAAITQIAALVPEIDALVQATDTNVILEYSANLVASVVQAGLALDAVARAIADADGTLVDFAGQFVERIFEAIVVRYLEAEHPLLVRVLDLLTIVEITNIAVMINGVAAYVDRRRLYFDKIGKLFQDPLGLLKESYRWGEPDFDSKALFARIGALFEVLAPLGGYIPADTYDMISVASLELFAITFINTNDADLPRPSPPGIQGRINVDVTEELDLTLAQLGDDWRIALGLKGTLGAGGGARILPPAKLELTHPTASVAGDISVGIFGQAPHADVPFLIFGMADSSRLEANQISAIVSAGAKFDAVAKQAKADIGFEVKVAGGKLVVESTSDGFLAKILPSDGLSFNFDFDLGWSSDRGFFFSGSAGLELALALNKTLGPFHLDTLHLLLGIAAAGIVVEASLDGGATLGPVACSVQRLGVGLDLEFKRGNLGPVQLDIAFKPPSGLGLVIDAGPVTGGGFISFDPQNGRYAGVLQLKLYEIGITAIGLLDTKLPGGKPGFSFLIIITVEFTPIQLGFGFTLNGVGGLAGINRTLVTEELRQGVRQHSLENILFPQNPIARATQLISDLGRIFPPAEGRYVFGPMVKLGWGTFVEAELGIIIELPSPVRIALLGEVNAYFPLKDEAIIEIHLDVLGIIDFGAQLFSLDASLHDSRVLLFGLSGDMAMRLSWGDDPSFAFSIGGLNPHFQPPPGFPTLRRLTLTLGYGDNPRLSLEGYFALTSNSFQFGAALSLYASLGALEVKGFLGFDALFIFSPFSFIIDFEADLDVTLGSWHFVGIHIQASLAGPTPWHISGELSVSLLFFDISVHVDFTLGDERHDTLPVIDTWTPLQQAIVAQTSWEGVRPPLALQAVKLSAPEGSDAPVLVDPVGGASLREKILPLGQTITRFAEVDIAPVRYELDSIVLGRTTITPPAVQDHFAPGAFRPMTDAEKISSPSFVWMQAGFTIASDAVALGGALTLGVQYTTRIIDAPDQRRPGGTYPMPAAALVAAARVAAAGTGLGAAGTARFAPDPRAEPRAAMNDEAFVIASTDDLQPRLAITPPTSKGLAQAALAQHLAANPGDRDRLQVIPAADAAA